MRTNFRHGLIAYQKDNVGNATYLQQSVTPGFVALNVSPDPTMVTIAQGASDYLVVFDQSVAAAWGPVVASVTNYLYVQVDLLTGAVSFGITTLEPITSAIQPVSPADGQHWFDLLSNVMKVWSTVANKWQPRLRVMVGRVNNGNLNQIVMYPIGTTVSLNVPGNPGYIITDSQLHPIRTSTGEFLTSDSQVRVRNTVGTAGVLAPPINSFIPVRAGENIPAMGLVFINTDGTVRLASGDPLFVNERTPVGIIQETLAVNDIGTITQFGEITYDQWDWTGSVGSPLYCDANGALTLTRPGGLLAYRVGHVLDARTILFGVDAETQPQVYQAGLAEFVVNANAPITVVDGTNGLGERVITISSDASTTSQPGYMSAAQATQLVNLGTRVTTAEADIDALEIGKSNVGHIHAIADVTNLQSSLDALTTAVAGKITKVSPATVGNFPALTADGSLVDSLRSPASFALAAHTHVIADVTNLQASLDSKANRAHLNAFAEIFTTVNRAGPTDIGSGLTLSAALASKVNLAGDTMTGDLVLAGNPTIALHAAPKQYVDTFVVEAREEGVTLTSKMTSIDFVGAGVTATGLGGSVTVTIPGGSGVTYLDELLDVDTSGPYTTAAAGSALTFHSGQWRAWSPFIVLNNSGTIFPGYNDLSPTDQRFTTVNFTGDLVATNAGSGVLEVNYVGTSGATLLTDLTDVAIDLTVDSGTDPVDNAVLSYSVAENGWVAGSPFKASRWVDGGPDEDLFVGSRFTEIHFGQGLYTTVSGAGTAASPGRITLDSLNPLAGNQLVYAGNDPETHILRVAHFAAGGGGEGGANTVLGIDAGGITNYADTINYPDGDGHTYVGYFAGGAVPLGDYNTFIGSEAGRNLTNGSGNTFLGRAAGNSLLTGTGNVAVGHGSAPDLEGGSSNVIIGVQAGANLVTGSNNILIGLGAGSLQANDSAGLLDGAVIINDEALRDGLTYRPWAIGSLTAGAASLSLAASLTVRGEGLTDDDAFILNKDGSLGVDSGDYGTTGYVLTSTGPGTSVIWAPAGGSASIATLSDVDLTPVAPNHSAGVKTGEALRYNEVSAAWEPGSPFILQVDGSPVAANNPESNGVFTTVNFVGFNVELNTDYTIDLVPPSAAVSTLSDVDFSGPYSGPDNGYGLQYDSLASTWIAWSPFRVLDELNTPVYDFHSVNPTDRFNTVQVNGALTATMAGQTLNLTVPVPALATLTDVDFTPAPQAGSLLKTYDGTTFTPGSAFGVVRSIISDVGVPSETTVFADTATSTLATLAYGTNVRGTFDAGTSKVHLNAIHDRAVYTVTGDVTTNNAAYLNGRTVLRVDDVAEASPFVDIIDSLSITPINFIAPTYGAGYQLVIKNVGTVAAFIRFPVQATVNGVVVTAGQYFTLDPRTVSPAYAPFTTATLTFIGTDVNGDVWDLDSTSITALT